jgi:hypothetical protein
MGNSLMLALLASVLLCAGAAMPVQADDSRHQVVDPDALQWNPVASLPPGAELAVIEGPMNEAVPFTVRLRFPPNYRLPAHWHPVVERVTVLSGVFHMGLGDRLDTSRGMALGPGGMMLLQPKTHHYAWTGEAATTIQLHGTGPWQIHYVDPADDPRLQGGG